MDRTAELIIAVERAELTRARDALQRMEDQYRSIDRDTADRYRRI